MDKESFMQAVRLGRRSVTRPDQEAYDQLKARRLDLSRDEAGRVGVLAEKLRLTDEQVLADFTAPATRKRVYLRVRSGLDVQFGEPVVALGSLVNGVDQGPAGHLTFVPDAFEFVKHRDQTQAEFDALNAIALAIPRWSHSSTVGSADAIETLVRAGIPRAWAHHAARFRTRATIELAVVEAHIRERLNNYGRWEGGSALAWLRGDLEIPRNATDDNAPHDPNYRWKEENVERSPRESYRDSVGAGAFRDGA